jgi:uncharacterized protein YbaR (Trm112 family)
MLKKDLLKILACPQCKGDVQYKKDIICRKCRLRYKVRNGIPDMLIDHAEKI